MKRKTCKKKKERKKKTTTTKAKNDNKFEKYFVSVYTTLCILQDDE
jgi:hypothetical protein